MKEVKCNTMTVDLDGLDNPCDVEVSTETGKEGLELHIAVDLSWFNNMHCTLPIETDLRGVVRFDGVAFGRLHFTFMNIADGIRYIEARSKWKFLRSVQTATGKIKTRWAHRMFELVIEV